MLKNGIILLILTSFCCMLFSWVDETKKDIKKEKKSEFIDLSVIAIKPIKAELKLEPLILPEVPQKFKNESIVCKYDLIWAKVTAYCPCAKCCGKMRGITSIGKSAWTKGIAADPKLIPYGTKIEIPQYGKSIVDDTGFDMRKSNKLGIVHLDVRMTYHWEAKLWGCRWIQIKVFKD